MNAAIAWVRKWAGGLAALLGAIIAASWMARAAIAAKRRSADSVRAASTANARVIWAESRAESHAARKEADFHMVAAKQAAIEAEQYAKKVAAAKDRAASLRAELGI